MTINVTDLRESTDFLNILFEKMPSLVLLADKDMRIQEVNDAYEKLFGLPREEAVGQLCGNALHCSFAVTEEKSCGETSNCERCFLRQSALAALASQAPTDREKLVHTFFVDGRAEERHFEFSTRHVWYNGQEMVLLILYDVTVLERQRQTLQGQQEKINESLEAAGCIQQSLLPRHAPQLGNVRFAWKFKPCDAIGGDILNIVPLDDARVGLYMLDVAGHGPPSAMISVLVYQMMNAQSGVLLDRGVTPPRIREPEEVLNLLNEEFPFQRFHRHFTLLYVVLDTLTGRMRYSNAAQCPPLVLSRAGDLRQLEVSGTIVGLSGIPFGQEEVALAEGDKVVLLSDGIEEAPDAAEELFGEERLHEKLRSLRQADPEELVAGIETAVADFVGPASPRDDISILAFEFLGPGQ